MSLIEDYNHHVNRGKRAGFNEWNHYREQIAHQVHKHIDSRDNVLVIGAGMCQDIPLDFLTKQFNRVVLTDVNIDLVREGIEKHALNDTKKQKITTSRLEYSGFEMTLFFESLLAKINTFTSSQDLINFINYHIERISEYSLWDKIKETYDFIFISPIYTQLIYQQILTIAKHLNKENVKDDYIEIMKSFFLEKMISIIDHFNDNIVRLVKKGGIIFTLSDIFEGTKDTPLINRFINHIEDLNVVEKIHQDYIEQYGYGLGDYGLISLEQRASKLTEKWLVWPFTKKRYFIVKQVTFKNGNN